MKKIIMLAMVIGLLVFPILSTATDWKIREFKDFVPYGKVNTSASIPSDWKLITVLPQQGGYVLWFQDKAGNIYIAEAILLGIEPFGFMIKGVDKLIAK